jgi:hypothetical protein
LALISKEIVPVKKIFLATAFIFTLVVSAFSVSAQTQSRDDIFKEIQAKRTELVSLEKKFLEPSKADREANADFLAQPNTGIIRLLPREKYDSNDSYKRALTIKGGGAYYSFVLSTHEYGRGSDIELQQGSLSVGFAGFDHGFLLNLGDVPLQEVTAEDHTVRALFDFKPALKETDIRREQRALWEGVDIGGSIFKSRVQSVVSNTYLLRSVSYDDSDIAVAFRVIREDADGSVILLFKVLKKFPAPKAEPTQTANN